jgi:hypothetical protein
MDCVSRPTLGQPAPLDAKQSSLCGDTRRNRPPHAVRASIRRIEDVIDIDAPVHAILRIRGVSKAKLVADVEADQIDKLQKAGMQVTRPDLAPFRALMQPAYKRIADYAGSDNVRKFQEMVEKHRKA